MKNILALLLFLISSSTCYAQDIIYSHPLNKSNQEAFNKIQSELSKTKNLSGKFEQIQQMRLLSSPLVSRGDFALSKNQPMIVAMIPHMNKILIIFFIYHS